MTTGLHLVREAVRITARKQHLGPMARDCGVVLQQLEDFSYGKGDLDPATVDRVIEFIWGGSVQMDWSRNLLRSASKIEAVSIGHGPPIVQPTGRVFDRNPISSAPRPLVEAKKVPKAARPGWLPT